MSAIEVRRALVPLPEPEPRLYNLYDETAKFTYGELTSLLEFQPGFKHLPSTSTEVFSSRGRLLQFGARLVNPTGIDFELARKWAAHCCDTHESCRDRYDTSNSSPEDFLLIDTQELCVCAAPQDTVYAALSYCWGSGSNAPSLRHTVANSASIMRPGALSSNGVPRTIEDAVVFAKKMGVRYLWVDVLCIVQDDAARKKRQIADMHTIYSNAHFTIIAASGVHSNVGIPGVRPGTRHHDKNGQKIIKIGKIKLVTVLDWTREGSIATTPWAKRAWTLQEHILSRRKVFITEDQIYWQCREACYAEEVVLEGIPKVEFTRHLIGPAFSFNLTRNPWSPNFEKVVRDYVSRQLSYRSDTLEAFTGVMNALQDSETQDFQKGFSWGLVVHNFNAELSWEMECTSRDNATLPVTNDGSSTIEVPYPTWSWTAWFGSEVIKPIWWEETGYAHPLIQFYMVDIHGRLLPILDGDESVHVPRSPDIGHRCGIDNKLTSDKKIPLRSLWHYYPRTTISCLETGEEFGIDSGKLKFWTAIGSLPIYRKKTANGTYTYHHGTFEGRNKLEWYIRPVKLTSPSTLDWQSPKTPIIPAERRFPWPRWGRKESPDLPLQGVFFGGPEPHGRIDPVQHVAFPPSTGDLQAGHNENEVDFSVDNQIDSIEADLVVIGTASTTIHDILRVLVVEWREGIAYRIGCAWIGEKDWVFGVEPKVWKCVTMG
jgi:hypothetical protein